MNDEINAKLAQLCTAYVETVEEMKDLEGQRQAYKDKIYSIMKELNVYELKLLDGFDSMFKVKEHVRTTKSFDKAGFATVMELDIDDCDQAGIAKEVENQNTNSEEVKGFLSKNKSVFITVKRVECKYPKAEI